MIQLADDPAATTYLTARRSWDERYGDLITRARNWRAAAWLSGAALLLSLGLNVYQRVTTPHVVWLVPVDASGRTGTVAKAESTPVTDWHLRAALTDWVVDLRSVIRDPQAERRAVDHVYDMLAGGSAAEREFTDWFRANSPFDRAQKVSVDVQVESILRTSDHTYLAMWTETVRNLGGEEQERRRWRGSLTYVLSPPKSETTARKNPIGLYVTDASLSEVETK